MNDTGNHGPDGRFQEVGQAFSDVAGLTETRPRHVPQGWAAAPQANSLTGVVELLHALGPGPARDQDLAERLGWPVKQVNKYRAAAQWLGLVDSQWQLTETGHEVVDAPSPDAPMLSLVASTLEYEVISVDGEEVLSDHLAATYGLHGDTVARRVGTWRAWARCVDEGRLDDPDAPRGQVDPVEAALDRQLRYCPSCWIRYSGDGSPMCHC